jgi:hypothetical protein
MLSEKKRLCSDAEIQKKSVNLQQFEKKENHMQKNYTTTMKSLLLALALAAPLATVAEPVSRQQARKIAAEFLKTRGLPSVLVADVAEARSTRNVNSAGSTNDYYIVNTEGEKGYVVVSGDNAFPAVLGYSTRGALDVEKASPALRELLQKYGQEMAFARENGIKGLRLTDTKAEIKPMTTSKWNQEAPYNYQLPFIYVYKTKEEALAEAQEKKKSKYLAKTDTYTGCFATALAQVMYYEGMKGRGLTKVPMDIPGRDSIYSTVVHAQQGNELYPYNNQELWGSYHRDGVKAGSTIDYQAMAPVYDGRTTPEQNGAVATLFNYIGAVMDMRYGFIGSEGSSAPNIGTIRRLAQYGWFPNICAYNQYDYSTDAWTDLAYQLLAADHVVLFGGTSSITGHSFVLDGYRDGYFHVNWGWGGDSDDYFLLTVLDADEPQAKAATKSGYSTAQYMYDGLYADAATPQSFLTLAGLHVDTKSQSFKGTYDIDGTCKIPYTLSIVNNCSASADFQLYLTLTDEAGQQQHSALFGGQSKTIIYADSVNQTNHLALENLADGKYILSAGYIQMIDGQPVTADVQPCVNSHSQGISITKTGNQVEAWNINFVQWEIVENSLKRTYTPGEEATVKIAVTSWNYDYVGPFLLMYVNKKDDKDNGALKGFNSLSLDLTANQTQTCTYTVKVPEKPGEYELALFSDRFAYPVPKAGNYFFTVGESTGISRMAADEEANDAIYDLQGRRVSDTHRKGLYIRNGKKVVVSQ